MTDNFRDIIKTSSLVGLTFLVLISLIPTTFPVFNKINNYLHQQYFERQGRIAEEEFAEHKLRSVQYPVSPTGICNPLERPMSESCEYFFRIGGKE